MEREREGRYFEERRTNGNRAQEVARGPWLRISATLVIPWPWGIIKSTRPPEIIMSPVNRAARLQRFELHNTRPTNTNETTPRLYTHAYHDAVVRPPTAKVACIRHTSIMPADNLKRSRPPPLLAQLPSVTCPPCLPVNALPAPRFIRFRSIRFFPVNRAYESDFPSRL